MAPTLFMPFVTEVLENIKIDIPGITKCIYFSDGAGSQYKDYKNKAEWHFFATSHGKRPCDVIGGTLKRLVAKASLQGVRRENITPPLQMLIGVTKTFLV